MRKGQALLELAIFVGLMLMVLLAALNYRRNLYEQRQADIKVFEDTKNQALNYTYDEKDIDDEVHTYHGATVNYTLYVDRQANRIFSGGQRRSVASSASVYWSPSESPKDLNYTYYNNQDLGAPASINVKVTRKNGEEDPEDGMKMATAALIGALYPTAVKLVGSLFHLGNVPWWNTYVVKWGKIVAYGILIAAFTKFLIDLNKSQSNRLALADQDKDMAELGWRVCDKVESEKDGCSPGKQYVRDAVAYTYGTGNVTERKSGDYHETQNNDSGARNVNLTHRVQHILYQRFDVSDPDHQILPMAQHQFQGAGTKTVNIDLSGAQSETWF